MGNAPPGHHHSLAAHDHRPHGSLWAAFPRESQSPASHDHGTLGSSWRRYSAVGTTAFLAPELIVGLGHSYQSDYWALGVLMFQCLTGKTPFRDRRSVGRTYDNIMYRRIHWPSGSQNSMSDEAKDLLNRLLEPDPSLRIGARGPDAALDELLSHPWFKKFDIDWGRLFATNGPFVPDLRGNADIGYFECTDGLSDMQWSVGDDVRQADASNVWTRSELAAGRTPTLPKHSHRDASRPTVSLPSPSAKSLQGASSAPHGSRAQKLPISMGHG